MSALKPPAPASAQVRAPTPTRSLDTSAARWSPTSTTPERAPMVTSRPDPRADASLSRTAALSSLSRTPSAPARTPVARTPELSTDPRRRYPRANLEVRARLSLADDPSRVFEATLPTVNISVGGMFLESSFFLKMGTRLLVELHLPPKGRTVNVKADVVRIETEASGQSGFALRFTEYLDGSEVVLATHFLSPVLREFITAYAKKHRFEAGAEYIAHTADVLAAWELKKAELGGDVWSLTSL
ncbi:MAG: PilZ domain-containing protein [Myxococcus sp.]|nr:PilZ domain-containing protein [Myxococcus sp.]